MGNGKSGSKVIPLGVIKAFLERMQAAKIHGKVTLCYQNGEVNHIRKDETLIDTDVYKIIKIQDTK